METDRTALERRVDWIVSSRLHPIREKKYVSIEDQTGRKWTRKKRLTKKK